MSWRCVLLGHRFGSWSVPIKETVVEVESEPHVTLSMRTRTTESMVQYRTCEPCGRQQRRIAEEPTLESLIR